MPGCRSATRASSPGADHTHSPAVAEAAGGTAPEIDLLLTGVAPLQAAGPDEVSFLDNRRYAAALEATSAGAVIVHPDMLARVPPGRCRS